MRPLIIALVVVATPVMAQPRLRLDQPQSIWRAEAEGTVEHLQSGLRCPHQVGDFERAGVASYDGFGFDVSCGYDGKNSTLTLYLTRIAGLDVDTSFVGAKQAVMQNQALRDAQLVSEGTGDQAGLKWRRAEFVTPSGRRSDIWVTDLNGWVLKYRATYQTAVAPAVAAELDALTRQVQASAGARTALCAKSQPPERKGRAARGRGANDGVMGAILGGLALAAADEKGEPPRSIVFCPEGPVARAKTPMLAWRGVLPDGTDAEVDRITPMTIGPPPTLQTAADPDITAVISELSERKSAPRWVATIEEKEQTMIFGYYEGRPPVATVASLMQRILDGKARPISSFSADGKTINIGMPDSK